MTDNPLNGQDDLRSKAKHFASLNDFKTLEEFPDTKSMVIVNFEGQVIYANHAFENSIGLFEGDNFASLQSDPSLLHFIEALAESTYSSFHFETSIPRKNNPSGSLYFVDVERIYIDEGEYFVLILTSAEDRAKIENKINTLHNALEYGNVPVIITDAEGKITFSTKSFETILNSSIEFLYNQSIVSVLKSYLSQDDLADIELSIREFKPCIKIISDIGTGGNVWYREVKITPAVKGENESISYIITANDITNYVLKNRIIKRSEERQKSIINNISDLLLIIRSERECMYVENANDNFYDIFTLKRERVLGKKIDEVFDKHFLMVVTQAIALLVKTNNSYREFRYKNYVIDREYLGSITYTDDHIDKQRIFIISLKDITEQLLNDEKLRKAYQKETHINKLKSSFLANMSHEIRTPLNAIVGYSELIEDDVKSGSIESAVELFPYLKEGFNRLLSLVDNILEVSLIESGETEFELSRTKVSQTVRDVYQHMIHNAVEKTLVFDLDIQDEDVYINADRQKLEKIISVLTDNAIKYTDPKGRVLLQTKADAISSWIIITDTGCGMAKDNLKRMFEPFTQEDEGHTRKYEGAGLGLTIAYNLTKLMGGELIVNSIIGEGTSITIIFPRFM